MSGSEAHERFSFILQIRHNRLSYVRSIKISARLSVCGIGNAHNRECAHRRAEYGLPRTILSRSLATPEQRMGIRHL